MNATIDLSSFPPSEYYVLKKVGFSDIVKNAANGTTITKVSTKPNCFTVK